MSQQCHSAQTLNSLSLVLEDTGKAEEGEQLQRRSFEIFQKLAADDPKMPSYRSALGGGANNRAMTLMDRGKWEEARTLLEQAIAHQKAALEIKPKRTIYQIFLSNHLTNLTKVQLALGDQAAAARTAEDYAHHIFAMARLGSDSILLFSAMYHCQMIIAEMEEIQHPDYPYPQQRESTLAVKFLLVKAVIKEAIQRAPDDPGQFHIADFLSTAPEPLRDPDLALRLARRAVELKPGDDCRLQSLSWALYRVGDFRGSIEAAKKTSDGGKNCFIRAMAHWQLGEKTEARARFDEANEWLKGYEQRCEEKRVKNKGIRTYPQPVQLKRLQTEATALLGVTPSPVKPEPVKVLLKSGPEPPSSKPMVKEKEKPK